MKEFRCVVCGFPYDGEDVIVIDEKPLCIEVPCGHIIYGEVESQEVSK